jgi:hypothetical protein
MITDNDIVKTVNDAIEGGEIEVSGGTQLYQHTITVSATEDEYGQEGDTYELVFISLEDESFANKRWNALCGHYLYGYIVTNGQNVVSVTNEQDEFKIVYYDAYGNQTFLYPVSPNILTDVVVAL